MQLENIQYHGPRLIYYQHISDTYTVRTKVSKKLNCFILQMLDQTSYDEYVGLQTSSTKQ